MFHCKVVEYSDEMKAVRVVFHLSIQSNRSLTSYKKSIITTWIRIPQSFGQEGTSNGVTALGTGKCTTHRPRHGEHSSIAIHKLARGFVY